MKKLNYILILLVLILFNSITAMKYDIKPKQSNKSSNERGETPETSAINPRIATKDTFVDEEYPDGNRGDANNLWSGWYGDHFCETYLYFSLSGVPSSWTTAELSVCLNPNNAPIRLTACRITANWDESTLTWNNKPAHGADIADIYVSVDQVQRCKVNLSAILPGLSSISICIYIDLPHAAPDIGSTNIECRDYPDTGKNRPQIIFDGYYGPDPVVPDDGNDDDDDDDETAEEFNIVGFLLSPIGLIIIGGSVTGAIAMTIIIIKRRSGKYKKNNIR